MPVRHLAPAAAPTPRHHNPRLQMLRNTIRRQDDEILRLKDEVADLRFAVDVLRRQGDGVDLDILPEHL